MGGKIRTVVNGDDNPRAGSKVVRHVDEHADIAGVVAKVGDLLQGSRGDGSLAGLVDGPGQGQGVQKGREKGVEDHFAWFAAR